MSSKSEKEINSVTSKKTKKTEYSKKDPIEQMKIRPDMWIGSTILENIEDYVVINEDNNIDKKDISISQGIIRIFVEPLSNAIDNLARSKEQEVKMTKIEVNIDEKTGETSIWNDGAIVPIEMNETEKVYNHTMIFGNLFAGSNYDDEKDRMEISGKNGVGVKCFALGTEIRMWDNTVKKIEDINLNEFLIGDDGEKREVIGMKKGKGELFTVVQENGCVYTVNKFHILSLIFTLHKKVLKNKERERFFFYVENNKIKLCYECGKCKNLSDCYVCGCDKKLETRFEDVLEKVSDDNRIDISVLDFLKFSEEDSRHFKGYIGFANWKKRKIAYNPYNVGFILDNENNNQEYKNMEENEEFKYLNKLHLPFNSININDYLRNSKENRTLFLEGIIDSKGKLNNKNNIIIKISPLYVPIIQNLVYSLGHRCSLISINTLELFLTSKICLKNIENNYDIHETTTGKIKIFESNYGEYIGLKVNKNERFLLKDYTVVHNCTNVFSKIFTVEGLDPENKKTFKQTWSANMKNTEGPEIKSTKKKTGYTKVTYIPDFELLNLEGYTKDIISVYKKLVVDTAMLTKLNVYYNGKKIEVNSLQDYAKLYCFKDKLSGKRAKSLSSKEEVEVDEKEEKEQETKENILYIKYKNSEVVVVPSSNQEFQQVSFANGICTSKGGVHVDSWSEAIFRPLVQKLNKPKKPQININDVKRFFRIFVVSNVNKPIFDSQSKNILKAPSVEVEVKRTHISNISKWEVMDLLEDLIRAKEMVVLKKTERKKKGYEKVEALLPANNEGGKNGRQCNLIIVEGASAQTYAVAGINRGLFGKCGRDWNGILMLRGKLLNTRNAKPTTISENKVITNMIKSLGLQYDVDYTKDENFQKLRYGKVVMITDADVDGSHITGLVINFFHSLFPSLLKREEKFLYSMQTPIVRVYLTKKDILFYDEREYRKYVNEKEGKNINKKYYKGLGASTDKDVQETFGVKMIEYFQDEKTTDTMIKTFHTKYTDQRKDWLKNYDSENIVLKWNGPSEETFSLSYSDFINTEMIKFSIEDCVRSIPNIMDGLKESQRKILYVVFLRNLKYNKKALKVAQLAGSVAEKSGYHHGEQILHKTITAMGALYVGGNNIPYLFRDGQFGTRLQGGEDASDGRYIHTKMDMLTDILFKKVDEKLLENKEDDGEIVEPKYYVPILPMILVNGTLGIGTGWSSNIPCYNPKDIIQCIKIWLEKNGEIFEENEEGKLVSLLPELYPWYNGFTGEITKEDDTKYISWGKIERNGKKVHVTELPIGYWSNDFEQFLMDLKADKEIKDYKANQNPNIVDFTIVEDDDGLKCDLKNLKLSKVIRTTNMVLFDENGKLKKYNSADEILDNFCKVRLEYYEKRKKYLERNLEYEIKYMGNKRRFLEEVRDNEIKFFVEYTENGKIKRKSKPRKEMIVILEERKFDKKLDDKENEADENDEEDNEEDEEKSKKKRKSNKHGYEYLLALNIDGFTEEKINKLRNDIENKEKELEVIKSTTEKEMWINDLEDFEEKYQKWLNSVDKEKSQITKVKKTRKTKKGQED